MNGDHMSEASWAALGALFAAVILKIVDFVLGRQSRSITDRKDLREELTCVWKRLDDLEKETDLWREKYALLNEKYTLLNQSYLALKDQYAALKADYDNLNAKYAQLVS